MQWGNISSHWQVLKNQLAQSTGAEKIGYGGATVEKRLNTFYAESFGALKAMDLTGLNLVGTVAHHGGWAGSADLPKGGGLYFYDGTTGPASTDQTNRRGFYDALGRGYRLAIDSRVGVPISQVGGVSDAGATDNSTAIADAYALAVSSNARRVYWDGQYGFATKIILPANVVTVGSPGQLASASALTESAIIWTGGAEPMFDMSQSRINFEWVTVANSGTATDFIEMNAGGQRLTFNWVFTASTPSYTRFSRSLVRSNGNRLGYSKIENLYAVGSPAPKLFDVDGQGTANGITTFSMRGGLVQAADVDMTVLSVKDEVIEVVNIEDVTFIDSSTTGILKIVDTTDAPLSTSIQVLNVRCNEIEVKYGAGAGAIIDLENVLVCNFEGNQVDGTGTEDRVIRAVNSNVNISGNSFVQLPVQIVDGDDNSEIVAGVNNWYSGTQSPIFTNAASGTGRQVQVDATAHILKLGNAQKVGHIVREIDVNTASGFSIRSVNSLLSAGLVMTVIVRNVSGAAIAAPSFYGPHFKLQAAATVAPADGYSRSFTFYYNGAVWVETDRGGGDVINA